ncbi:MAG: hypothetical protein GKR89_31550 [Candidatus Latescibacteria bacterium]|nr:hypothetical protein [Candidatus Latescibacterota bacterium]
MQSNTPIPFDALANFQRLGDKPILACPPPEWGAAAHALVVGDTVHYLWARRKEGNYWVLMHSTAPTSDPTAVEHDPRNPVLLPSQEGFDDFTVEYPFPFFNPADNKLYAYYLGRRQKVPKQTGLLIGEEDFGQWTRVRPTPVIAATMPHERKGSSHPSVAILEDTIHIVYTGESDEPPVLCHATASTADPATVTKDPANPVFKGSGQAWDSQGVREAEILRDPEYFHLFYGGTDGQTWRIGHVRTRDFRTFEANPHNPILSPSPDREAWDCDGLLTPQVFAIDGAYYMLYAGLKGREWQSGLAVIS